MWSDGDWRALPVGAQHLYMLILTHSTLNYAGVGDWPPGRLAALTAGRTAADIESDAEHLRDAAFIYTDLDTEEVLVRSFLRHDGVIKHPRLHVSMANDWACVASPDIRAFVAFELSKLHDGDPSLPLWKDARVKKILLAEAKDLKGFSQSFPIAEPKPMANPLPKDSQSFSMQTATATATTTSSNEDKRSGPRKRGHRLPEDFAVTPEMYQWASSKGFSIDIQASTERFINHWTAASGSTATKLDWVAAWRNWLLGDQQRAAPRMDHSARARAKEADMLARFHASNDQTFLEIEG
jgi:hypothetical protein